jgi:hypothetical protein
VWCSGCDSGTKGTYDWAYCKGTADYLLAHLLNGASACFPWEGYDSIYAHHGYAWSYWGLFAVDNINAPVKTYTPRKHFYTVAQISKWVRPGAQRINVSGTTSPFTPLLAFKHPGLGQVTIVGINTSGSAATLSGTLASLPAVPYLDLYYTSATTNLAYVRTVAVTNGNFTTTIPADCVFTLASISRVTAAITYPGALPGSVVISWPSSEMGWRLQQSTGLSFPTWTNLTAVPVVDGTNFSVTIGPLSGNSSFRLVKP